jgi:hypothetical protein
MVDIRTMVETSSYYETFKSEWSSVFLIWAPTKTVLFLVEYDFDLLGISSTNTLNPSP